MKQTLGDIKLNVLKIGDDMAEPNFFDMKKTLDGSKIDFDPSKINIKEIKAKMEEARKQQNREKKDDYDESVLTPTERRAFRYMLDYSEKMFNDLKEVSYRFVEIKDLEPYDLFKLTDKCSIQCRLRLTSFHGSISSRTQEELSRITNRRIFWASISAFNGIWRQLEKPDSSAGVSAARGHQAYNAGRPGTAEDHLGIKGYDEEKGDHEAGAQGGEEETQGDAAQQQITHVKGNEKAQMLLTMNVGEGSVGQFLKLLLSSCGSF